MGALLSMSIQQSGVGVSRVRGNSRRGHLARYAVWLEWNGMGEWHELAAQSKMKTGGVGAAYERRGRQDNESERMSGREKENEERQTMISER